MNSEPTYLDEAQMIADLDPDPGADPDFWLDAYPCMTMALADQADGMTAQDVAELLSDVVNTADGEHLDDSTVLNCYLDSYVLVPA